jgi:KaiC/GvpD/RAD55 family RecA-like ATPase
VIQGGVSAASSTLLFGATGSSKTLLVLHFLAAGARLSQPSLCFGMFERPSRLIAKVHAVGLPVQRYLDTGSLEVVWQSQREAILDVYAEPFHLPQLLVVLAQAVRIAPTPTTAQLTGHVLADHGVTRRAAPCVAEASFRPPIAPSLRRRAPAG